ncbi:carbohydrate sulfotransferase 4-like isoform X2 [Homarus americanus]|nr:carbohydrate sulfotransferase 4-like isoform X2 [Homarus americanus]XP_042242251.1 carbohydrate sulfotransferase 4-like isoform X2 [Homarus americanus]XP_042242253.1 carbohydrate sulfotransferase 4-like isoform X2 [Homarus americanus]
MIAGTRRKFFNKKLTVIIIWVLAVLLLICIYTPANTWRVGGKDNSTRANTRKEDEEKGEDDVRDDGEKDDEPQQQAVDVNHKDPTQHAGVHQKSQHNSSPAFKEVNPSQNQAQGGVKIERNKKSAEDVGTRFNVLLLSSMGRSGSSFVGGLLRSQPGVFYFFEPLHRLGNSGLITPQTAIQELQGIFTCNISDVLLKGFRKEPKFTIRHNYIHTCGKDCFKPKQLNQACRSEPIRVVKTIRTRLSWLLPLLNDSSSRVKVIHLVRDPRGALISAWKIKWTISSSVSCCDIRKDLYSGKDILQVFPNRYLAVRYEDLCSDPWGMARLIFNFLGYQTLPPSTVAFVKSYTSHGNPERTFGIKRNTHSMQQKWRGDITEAELKKIETTCNSTIIDIGFNLFHNLDAARNLSLPLYIDSKTNQFFPNSTVH